MPDRSWLRILALIAPIVAGCAEKQATSGPTGDDDGGVGLDATPDAPAFPEASLDGTVEAAVDAGADGGADAPADVTLESSPVDAPPDAAPDSAPDAAADAAADAGADAAQDAPQDAPQDAAQDAPEDVLLDVSPEAPASDAAPGPPTVLVSNIYNPRHIAVDDTNVYFTALDPSGINDGIYQIAKNAPGTMPIELSGNDRQPWSLASDGTYVYWNDTLDPRSIRRIIIGGNGATTLAGIAALGVSLSPTTLFWVDSTGNVQSMPKAGGTVTTMGTAPMGATYGVAIDANYFYFAASASSASATISRIPLSGGPVTTVATPTANVNVLAVDSSNVYFVAGDNLSSAPIAGGPISVIAGGFTGTTSLKVDSGNLYVSISISNAPNGSIVRIPVTGGTPTVLASAQWGAYDLAVDATSVYWTDYGGSTGTGTVMMTAK